jgi:hypothetical protein
LVEGIFQMESFVCVQADLNDNLPMGSPMSLGWQVCTTTLSFYLLRWILVNFFPGLASKNNLNIHFPSS